MLGKGESVLLLLLPLPCSFLVPGLGSCSIEFPSLPGLLTPWGWSPKQQNGTLLSVSVSFIVLLVPWSFVDRSDSHEKCKRWMRMLCSLIETLCRHTKTKRGPIKSLEWTVAVLVFIFYEAVWETEKSQSELWAPIWVHLMNKVIKRA
jgi:hypothetical protein